MHLNLSPDELLTTTRSVRKRLDLSRPVEPEVIRECLELAVQAPTGSNNQNWHFIVVTDARQRLALADIYRKGFAQYLEQMQSRKLTSTGRTVAASRETMRKIRDSSQHLLNHMHEVPVMLIPCIQERINSLTVKDQASTWGSILPATWSFMLAARERGLGTCWTTVHLYYEEEAAEVLGIPYEEVMQAALIPVAYALGTEFKPAARAPLESAVHWERW